MLRDDGLAVDVSLDCTLIFAKPAAEHFQEQRKGLHLAGNG